MQLNLILFFCFILFHFVNDSGEFVSIRFDSIGARKKRGVNYWFHSLMKSSYQIFGFSLRFWTFSRTFMSPFSLFWPFFWWLYLKQYYTMYSDWVALGADANYKRKLEFQFSILISSEFLKRNFVQILAVMEMRDTFLKLCQKRSAEEVNMI